MISVFNLQVETTTFRDSILDVAAQRNDALGKAVMKRITPVDDLIAADAEYHRACLRRFISIKAGRETAGRPENERVNAAMEGIYRILEDSDDCQHSIPDLINKLEGYVILVITIVTTRPSLYEAWTKECVVVSAEAKE